MVSRILPGPNAAASRGFTRGRRRQGSALLRCEGTEFQDRVPVTPRTTGVKLLVDEGIRQARAADTVRVNDVEVFVRSANDFGSRNGRLQRLHPYGTGRVLE